VFPRDSQAASSPPERALANNSGQFSPGECFEDAGDQGTSWFVVGSNGIRGRRPGRKAKAVWKDTATEEWKGKKTKKIGRKIDSVT